MKKKIKNKPEPKAHLFSLRQEKQGLPGPSEFSVSQIIRATGGRLIAGDDARSAYGVSSDSRALEDGNLFIALRGGRFNGHDFINAAISKGARIIIVDRDFRFDAYEGISAVSQNRLSLNDCGGVSFIRVDNTIRALCDLAAFHRRRFDIPVVGITGSCGKTTTKDMLYCVLSTKFNVLKNKGTLNNFIGVSHTLLRLNSLTEIALVEMGTSNFGEIKRLAEIAMPNVGIITNVGASHLKFFKALDCVANEKYDLVRNLEHPDIAILNGDDMRLDKKKTNTKNLKVFTFGINKTCDFAAFDIKSVKALLEFRVNRKHKFRLNVLGRHNVYNALAAISCGIIFGVSPREIKKGLSGFAMPQTRINYKKIKGYQIIDDTYNSNPLSLKHAIETIGELSTKGKKVFVMGDMLELGEKSAALHRAIAEKIIKSGIDTLITVGPLSHQAADFIKSKKTNKPKVYSCGCNLEAKGILLDLLECGDLVLVKGSRGMRMEEIIKDL